MHPCVFTRLYLRLSQMMGMTVIAPRKGISAREILIRLSLNPSPMPLPVMILQQACEVKENPIQTGCSFSHGSLIRKACATESPLPLRGRKHSLPRKGYFSKWPVNANRFLRDGVLL